MAEELLRDLRKRAKRVDQMRQDAETGTQRTTMQLGLRLTAIEAARAKLLSDHRDELESDDMSLLIAELDLEEQQIRLALGER
jgi:monovalent cation/hydrogen antiporter